MVYIGDGVDMEMFEKFVGFIEETGGMPQEEVRGVDGGVGIATLRRGNDVMAADTADAEGKDVLDSTIAYSTYKGM